MRRERPDNQIGRAGNGLCLKNRLGKDHVVGEVRRFVCPVRIDRPQALNRQSVFVDVFPAAKENSAVRQNRRIKLCYIVDRNRVNVGTVGVHDVKNRHAVVGARHQTTVSGGRKDDSPVRQPRRANVVMSAAGTLVRIPFGVEVGQLLQPCAVQIDFVNNRVPVGRSLVTKQNRFAVVRQSRIKVDAVAQRRVGRRVDKRSNPILLRRVSGVLENVNPAHARILHAAAPLIKRVVNVQALIVVPSRKENRKRQPRLGRVRRRWLLSRNERRGQNRQR